MKHEISKAEIEALDILLEQVMKQIGKLILDVWALNTVAMMNTRIKNEVTK